MILREIFQYYSFRFEEHYQELFEKRKIFEKVEKLQTKDVYSFDLHIPKSFNSAQVNKFLTHQLVEIEGEFVDVGIGKPAQKGQDMYESNVTILVEYCLIDSMVIFCANVEASMISEVYYPQVCIDLNDGLIFATKCSCEASEGGTCTHVSCLLHVILDICSKKDPNIARPGTSKVK